MMRNEALTREEVANAAPSICAAHAYAGASDRYRFIQTSEVLAVLDGEGWHPVAASEQRVRSPERRGYQKHMIRLRRRGGTIVDVTPEIVLVNSHDARCALQFHAGLFRLVCENGLIIADTSFGKIRMPHVGFDSDMVRDAAAEFARRVPMISARVDEMRSLMLTTGQQRELAQRAIEMRWGTKRPVGTVEVLAPRRGADEGSDLWTVYNVVQENIIRGGLLPLDRRSQRTRAVRAIDSQVRLNASLWQKAVEILES